MTRTVIRERGVVAVTLLATALMAAFPTAPMRFR